MSRRRPPPPPPDRPPEDPLDRPLEDPEPELPLLLVEYFVDELELSPVRTSVPKSVHSSHTSSSAPSILTVFGLAVSDPHISHWTIPDVGQAGA